MSFTVITQNLPGKANNMSDRDEFRRRLTRPPRKGVPAPSLGGAQEARWLLNGRFQKFMPDNWSIAHEHVGQPVFWDNDIWRLRSQDSFAVTKQGVKVGRRGAGPSGMDEKRIQWFHFVERETKRNLRVYNLHAVPSIHLPKQKDGDISRWDLWDAQMDALVEHMAKNPYPTIVLGDFNEVWAHAHLSKRLGYAGLRLMNNKGEPTMNGRQIDLILARNGQGERFKLRKVKAGTYPPLIKREHRTSWATVSYVK